MQKIELDSKDVAIAAITASLYIALGYLFQPISFLGIQFRVAELIVGICIIYKVPGMLGKIIGVFFVNLSSPLGPIDLLSCIINVPALLCIVLGQYYDDKYELKFVKYLGGLGYAVIISLYVATILFLILGLPFEIMFLQVLISEVILAVFGIYIFTIVKKRLVEQ